MGVSVEVNVPGRNTMVAKDSEERRELKNDHTAAINRAFQAIERQLEYASQLQNRNVKAHEAEGEAGVVVRLFPEQSYGFVEVKGSPDLYFTRNAVVGGSFDDLEPGTVVHVTRATSERADGPAGELDPAPGQLQESGIARATAHQARTVLFTSVSAARACARSTAA